MKCLLPVLLLALAVSCSQGHAAAPSQPRTVAPTTTKDAALQAVELLWPELEERQLSRSRWEQSAHLASAALGRDHPVELLQVDLLQIVGDGEATPLQRVAAAELFRRLPRQGLAPTPEDLARLRHAAYDGIPDSALASAARLVLADLGDWSDRLRLVRELETKVQPEVRSTAAWCLEAARGSDVLPDLVRLLGPGFETSVAALAATTLQGICAAEPLEGALQAELVDLSIRALDTPFCPAELDQCLTGLLGVLDDARARGRLELLTREGREEAARALAASETGRKRLAHIAHDPFAHQAGRRAAAGALGDPVASLRE